MYCRRNLSSHGFLYRLQNYFCFLPIKLSFPQPCLHVHIWLSYDLLFIGTFDVQKVEMGETDNDEYEMTCYFAAGSKARGCRIVLIHEDNGECELNVTRPEGSGEAVMKVTLPAGQYSLLVYDDDDDMSQQNPAFTTTLQSSATTNSHNTGIIYPFICIVYGISNLQIKVMVLPILCLSKV